MIKNTFINNFSIDLIEDCCKLYKKTDCNKNRLKLQKKYSYSRI